MKCDCMKIIGCMQVGGNCSWILNTSLSNMSEIVDEIVLVGGNVSDDSKKLLKIMTKWSKLIFTLIIVPV